MRSREAVVRGVNVALKGMGELSQQNINLIRLDQIVCHSPRQPACKFPARLDDVTIIVNWLANSNDTEKRCHGKPDHVDRKVSSGTDSPPIAEDIDRAWHLGVESSFGGKEAGRIESVRIGVPRLVTQDRPAIMNTEPAHQVIETLTKR